jgi:hypothetical protein
MNKDARNEQRKLIANFLNNVGTGVISAGVLTPIAALVLGVQTSTISATTIGVVMGTGLFSGISFHAIGRLFLIGYEQ